MSRFHFDFTQILNEEQAGSVQGMVESLTAGEVSRATCLAGFYQGIEIAKLKLNELLERQEDEGSESD